MERVRIVLRRAPDDPAVNSPEFQAELSKFEESLRSNKVRCQRPRSVTGVSSLRELVITIGPHVVTVLSALGAAWIGARFGRSIRIKAGNNEVEARTKEEIEFALKKLRETEQNNQPTERS
jgi:hypothetical protein